jgi:hypothetical protein
MFGSRTSARPIATRCISPPESAVARLSSLWRCAPSRDRVDPRGDRLGDQGAARRAQGKGEVLAHAQMRIERVLLEDEGGVAGRRFQPLDPRAADADLARVLAFDAGDQAQGRGLAGTGRAEQDDELAVRDGQREVAHRAGAAEGLGQTGRAPPQPSSRMPQRSLRSARPPVASKSDSRAGGEREPDRLARIEALIRRNPRLDPPVGGLDRDDLVGAEIFHRIDRPRSAAASSKRMCSGRTPSASGPEGASSCRRGTGIAWPARRTLIGPGRHRTATGRKFIGGAPMKSATYMLAGRA